MSNESLKKYIFRAGLLFILLLSLVLCIYSLKSYKSSTAFKQSSQFGDQRGMHNYGLNNAQLLPGMMSSNNIIDSNDFKQGEINRANKNQRIASSSNYNRQFQDNNGKEDDMTSDNQINSNTNNQQKHNKNIQHSEQNGNMQRGGENNNYFLNLTIYSVIFLLLSCGIYYLFKSKTTKINLKDEKLLIFTLLAAGLFLRVAASTLFDGHNDVNLFENWASNAANGISQFYTNAKSADYPPLYIYVLALIGKMSKLSIFNSYYILMLKMPSIIADIVTAYFIYKLGKKYIRCEISIFMAAFYIFNPAVFIDSTFWGQVDSFFTLLIVLAVFLLSEKKIIFSTAMFVAAVLMKPQGIIFLPILFFELVRERNLKSFIKAIISATVTSLIIIIPFSLKQQSPLWIFNLYSNTISEYPYASVNAFNFFSLLGANYKDNTNTLFIFNYHTFGMIFIVITTLISWFVYIKNNNRNIVSAIALLQISGVFTFSVGMHERYLFPAVALAILTFIYLNDKRFFIMAMGFSVTSYLNISSVLFKLNSSTFKIILMVTSFLNVLLVIYLIKSLIEIVIKKNYLLLSDDNQIL